MGQGMTDPTLLGRRVKFERTGLEGVIRGCLIHDEFRVSGTWGFLVEGDGGELVECGNNDFILLPAADKAIVTW